MTARAEIRIRSQELVEPRTVRVTFADAICVDAGDVLELTIADVTGPFVISAIREMNANQDYTNPDSEEAWSGGTPKGTPISSWRVP